MSRELDPSRPIALTGGTTRLHSTSFVVMVKGTPGVNAGFLSPELCSPMGHHPMAEAESLFARISVWDQVGHDQVASEVLEPAVILALGLLCTPFVFE